MDALASLFAFSSVFSCIVTLYTLHWMLIARNVGKEIQRAPARVSLPSRKALYSPTVSSTRFSSLDRPSEMHNMLQGAVHKYDKEHGTVKQAPPAFLHSSPSSSLPAGSRNTSSINPGYRNPLRTTPASELNGRLNTQSQCGMQTGVKRTANGLAKALNGKFDDGFGTQHRPIVIGGESTDKSKVVQVTQDDFIDENDFDSDIELDVAEPTAKRPLYPRLDNFRSPPRPVVYPTLPRQQQAQTSHSIDLDRGYAPVGISPVQNTPKSSVPLPWSSSPAEHFAPASKPSVIQSFTYNPTTTQHAQSGPPPAAPQPRPAKRRHLPWQNEETEQPTEYSTASSKVSRLMDTSTPGQPKSSKFLWNTSASAVKEQQKQHRQDNKKAIKKNEGDEDAIRAAKTSRDKQPPRVFLSEEQQHVLKLITDDKMSVFFTGSAGTGKSVLMREIITTLRKKYAREPDRVAVTASTGLAACNVGGVTLHSFGGIGLGKEEPTELVRKIKRNQKAKQRWMRTKVLIIDEISMVDGDLFDKLESVARQIRNNGRPFGGIQLVITGDFFQLPPVPEQQKPTKFAFEASTWKTTIAHTIALHHVFRQKDPVFAGMLNEMREGRLQQSSINAFRNLSRPLGPMHDLEATELFPTRVEVDNANQSRLRNLQGAEELFEARDGGMIQDKIQRDKLLQNCMAPEKISLKKGCQVMLIKNIDESLVNGSIGKVMGFMDEGRFDSYTATDAQDVNMRPDGTFASSDDILATALVTTKKKPFESVVASSRRWPVVRFVMADGSSRDLLCQPESYKIELPNGEVQASRLQIPLILAWALSIHKAQGQTLERVKVDLGKVFEKGQAYVALSRATNMAGLQVLRFDPGKVVAHERVRHFYANLSRVELLEKSASKRNTTSGRVGAGMGADEYERRFVEDDEWNV